MHLFRLLVLKECLYKSPKACVELLSLYVNKHFCSKLRSFALQRYYLQTPKTEVKYNRTSHIDLGT